MLNKRQANKPFLRIAGGNIVVPANQGDEGAQERIITSGKREGESVWEHQYGSLTAHIIGGRVRKNEELKIWLMDIEFAEPYNDDTQTLRLQFGGPLCNQIVRYFPNVDLTKQVTLGVGTDKEKGTSFAYMKQGEDVIHSAFTKDNPNGCPAPIKKEGMDDGDIEWDWTPVNKFLKGVAEKFFDQAKAEYNVRKSSQQTEPKRETVQAEVAPEEDDIAF